MYIKLDLKLSIVTAEWTRNKADQFKKLKGDIFMSPQNLERFLRNSIPLSTLIQKENNGLGNITITELLDSLQELYISGKVDNHYDILKNRIKPKRSMQDDKLYLSRV